MYRTAKVEQVYSLGRVCQLLHNPLLYRTHPFPVCAGLSTTLFLWSKESSNMVDEWFHHNSPRPSPEGHSVPGVSCKLPQMSNQVGWFPLRLPCEKLSPRFIGSLKIIRQDNSVNYQLQLPPQYCISPSFHISLLKPAYDPLPATDSEQGLSPQLEIDGSPTY